jgi:hypothetical protein
MSNPEFQAPKSAIIGIPHSAPSNVADVNTSNELLVSAQYQAAGSLNATGQVSVGATATLIIAANTRQGVIITNPSSTTTVYIGGSGVTTSNGQELLPNQSLTLPVVSAIYGVVASSTQTVSYLEVI